MLCVPLVWQQATVAPVYKDTVEKLGFWTKRSSAYKDKINC